METPIECSEPCWTWGNDTKCLEYDIYGKPREEIIYLA